MCAAVACCACCPRKHKVWHCTQAKFADGVSSPWDVAGHDCMVACKHLTRRPLSRNRNFLMKRPCCKMGGHRLRSSMYSGDRNLVSSLSAKVYVKISNNFARFSHKTFLEPLEAQRLREHPPSNTPSINLWQGKADHMNEVKIRGKWGRSGLRRPLSSGRRT